MLACSWPGSCWNDTSSGGSPGQHPFMSILALILVSILIMNVKFNVTLCCNDKPVKYVTGEIKVSIARTHMHLCPCTCMHIIYKSCIHLEGHEPDTCM